MDGRSVLLAKVDSTLNDSGLKKFFVSSALKYMLEWTNDNQIAAHSLMKQSYYEHKLAVCVWKETFPELESVIFSEDGKQFALLLNKIPVKQVVVFKINDQNVVKVNEWALPSIPEQPSGTLSEPLCETPPTASEEPCSLLHLSNKCVVIQGTGYVGGFRLTDSDECLENYFISFPSQMCSLCTNQKALFCLNTDSTIYIYSVENGDLLGVFDVRKALPSTMKFLQISVDSVGNHAALLAEDNIIYIFEITSTTVPSPNQTSAQASSASVSSFKTSTSKTSNYSRVESLRRESGLKKMVSLANASSANSTWTSYLEKLSFSKKVQEGIVEESLPLICIKDIPNSYAIHSIHFCQESLGVWATHKDESSDGFYRLYEKHSGFLESVDILAADTCIVPINYQGLRLDLFLQSSNLCIPLGIISRETLVQKMVGGESEGLMGQMIGLTVSPLPLLQDGLANSQIDMMRLALNLLTQGFKVKLVEGDSAIEELLESTGLVFDTIAKSLETADWKGKWGQQVRMLALTHANTLLSLCVDPSSHTSLQVLILQHVISLRRGEALAIHVPTIPLWVSWLALSDEEVILHSVTSLPLVQCFLSLHRDWSQQDFQGDRFYNTVHRVMVNLLKQEKLEQTVQLLASVNLDPDKELETLLLKTKSRPLRDYLVNNLSSKLKVEYMNAWKFLCLVESILIKYMQYFASFEQSPLSVSQVSSLGENSKMQIMADLYFCSGDKPLKSNLEKNACWDYLLKHNYSEGLLSWLGDSSVSSTFPWPAEHFLQWKVDPLMVDRVVTSNSSDLTKLLVLNRLARQGIFTNEEQNSTEKLMLRLALGGIFPDLESTLDTQTDSFNYNKFLELITQYAIKHNLVNIAVQADLQTIDSSLHASRKWLKLFQLHTVASNTLKESDILEAVQGTTQYLAALQPITTNLYLKQHPLVAIVTSLLENQDVCQLYSHVSPLLAASLPPSSPPQDDTTLYSVLAHTLPFHVDNIFHHQLQPKKDSQLPNFRNENLSSRFGIRHSLGFRELLKQGRPASAVCFILHNGKFKTRIKSSVGCAHGLALNHVRQPEVTSACVAFVKLLGRDSTLLQTHIATAVTLSLHVEEKQLREQLLHLVQGREGASAILLGELENCLKQKWSSVDPGCRSHLQDFHLAVRLSVSHKLAPPTSLLQHCLDTDNWLLFIIAAQLFQLPLNTVQELCKKNSKYEISKHLFYALQATNKSQDEVKVCKTFEPESNLFALLASCGSDADVLLSLSLKLNSPTLALLASSVETIPVEVALSTWLVASMTPDDAADAPEQPWNPQTVTQLLVYVVRQGYFHTLSQGLYIYQPTSPLVALANFFTETVVLRKFKESIISLRVFISALFRLSNQSTDEVGFLMTRTWVTITAFRMVCTALTFCFPSAYLRRCFLQTLCDAQFSDIHQDGRNLPLYLRLSQCLEDTPLELDWEVLCLHQDSSPLPKTLASLAQLHLFDIAYKFAQIAQLPSDNVLVTQWSVMALSEKHLEPDFWQKCDAAFQQANIQPHTAVDFYQKQVKLMDNLNERYILLKFALNWMHKTNTSKDNVTALQIELYMTCLHEKFKPEVMTEGVEVAPLRCLSHSLPTSLVLAPPRLSVTQTHRLDSIIHQHLVVGHIKTAFLLQTLFHYTNQDCELLLACMQLAEGVVSLTKLSSRIQEYLADNTVRPARTIFTSPVPKLRRQNEPQANYSQNVLSALYSLQAHQTCPTPLFSNIISAYNVSLTFHTRYQDEILNPEPLERLLPTHDFDVASNLLNLTCLTRSDSAQYICSQILAVLNSEPVEGKYILWSCDLENKFSCILDLSGSALLLGNLLLAADPPLTTLAQPSSYRQVVELLVLAHQCYTKICHMEGISIVLNLARSLVNRLLDCCQWLLMVRLLTGIGRYTEMVYVFQILKDNDQFEFLLGKGLDKQPELMSASLEFVRGDKALFSLVAHHFSMYAELAALYEEEARVELAKLEVAPSGALVVSTHNMTCLQAAMSKYSDAAEHYMQAKKMKCGVSSVQQAELTAVQLSLIAASKDSAVPCLINLSSSQALQSIYMLLTCEQAHMVASAYNVSVDWSAALYQHCVVRGDTSYLQTWSHHHHLSQSVVQDVVRRFQSERETTPALELNMKWFVSSVDQLEVKYRVASQLGFKDVLQSLLNSSDMAYLKDTVWQSGFKKQIL